MFLNAFKLKSSGLLKRSDAEELRQRLDKDFPNINIEQLIPSKLNISRLKIITYDESAALVYCVDKVPMFFELKNNNRLVPSVYCLWQVHDLLPYFTILPSILPRLKNDLVLYDKHLVSGQIVALNLTTNRAAVGVGLCIKLNHGNAVKILHLFGDKLWELSPNLKQIPDIYSQTEEQLQNTEDVLKSSTKMSPEIMEISKLNLNSSDNSIIKNDQEENVQDNVTNTIIEEIDTNNSITADKILKKAFLSALKKHGKALQLPLLTSNFYRVYVVPEAEQKFDIKKTTFKKLSNFLNDMVNEGFIAIREESKGIDKITSIDFQHPELISFIAELNTTSNIIGGNTDSGNQLFHSTLTEMYIVTMETAPLFTTLDYLLGEGIPANKIKNVIREYVSKQHLTYANEQMKTSVNFSDVCFGANLAPKSKTYNLDNTLQKICGYSTGSLHSIFNAVIAKMQHTYKMEENTGKVSNKPMIQMSLANRRGNKKVTLVKNMKFYGIKMSEFTKLCKQGAAASATIITLPHEKYEVFQIQGNQIRFLYNLLTNTYKIPQKNISGLEFAKSQKKS